MTFASPYYLFLLILLPIALYLKLRSSFFSEGRLQVSTLSIAKKAQSKNQSFWIHLPFFLILFSLFLLILTLARPQHQFKQAYHNVEGIEIILAIDTSISMWFLDDEVGAMQAIERSIINGVVRNIYIDGTSRLKRRIHIAKKVLLDFISKRETDKIGIVAFKARGITLTPPTMKQSYLQNLVKKLNLGMILNDGTAIGDALGSSINALNYSKSKNKIIILVTDGNDNQERLPSTVLTQLEAAKYAAQQNIKIYTIGMGGKGRVFAPYRTGQPGVTYAEYENSKYFIEYRSEQINERPLRQISQITGGKFYRANNESQLQKIYSDIDKLEKSEFKERYFIEKNEIFLYFLIPAVFIFLLALFSKYILFRVLP